MKILTAYQKLFNFLNAFRKPPQPTPGLKKKIDSFKKNRLTKSLEATSTETWKGYQTQLLELLKNGDLTNFINWEPVRKPMFFDAPYKEFHFLRKSKFWKELQVVLSEDKIGNPPPYFLLNSSSGNLVHHLYSLVLGMEKSGFHPKKVKNVFEFGGGYGSFCRIFYKMGFEGNYTIFDFPVYNFLQEFFLSTVFNSLKIGYNNEGNSELNLVNDISVIKKGEVDLLIGLWSLSECPIELRNEILDKVNANYYLIAFQHRFEDIDNMQYFKDFAEKKAGYQWEIIPITHLKGHYYLLGQRIDSNLQVSN